MKVINYTPLKPDSLINIGDSYIVVSIGDEENNDDEEYNNKAKSPRNNSNNENSNELNRCVTDNKLDLHLKIYSGQLKIEPSTFRAEDKAVCRLGRTNDAEVSINDNMLSRLHCYIEFDASINTWILYDGYISEEEGERRPSTNGTWLYLKDDTEIVNHFIFKANHTVFKSHVLER